MLGSNENMKPLAWLAAGALSLAAAIPVAAVAEPGSDKWTYSAQIYFWMPDIDITTATGGEVDISFHDILKNLKMTFMGNVAAYKGKWSLFADGTYLNIYEDDAYTESVPILGGRRDLDVDVDAGVNMKAFVGTLGATYNVFDNQKVTANLVGGARYMWIDVDLKLDLSSTGLLGRPLGREIKENPSGTVWDGIVGVKGKVKLNDKWYLPYYADVGTGQSDLTWQAQAGVGYKFKHADALLTYRYLHYEFDSGDALDDLTDKGPQVGAKFYF